MEMFFLSQWKDADEYWLTGMRKESDFGNALSKKKKMILFVKRE
jgi:hypothetical protein